MTMNTEQLHLQIANLSLKDKKFISGVVALFTDPRCQVVLAQLQKADCALHYDPQNGECCVRDHVVRIHGNN